MIATYVLLYLDTYVSSYTHFTIVEVILQTVMVKTCDWGKCFNIVTQMTDSFDWINIHKSVLNIGA